jgi:hypothetical protein
MSPAITYKPVQSRIYGLATVKIGERAAKITWKGDEEISKKVNLENLPDTPKLPTGTEKVFYVVYNSDTGMVESISPERGVFKAKCVDFSRPEKGADPEPIKSAPFREGEPPQLYFKAWFKIIEGNFKGVLVPINLPYKLRKAPDGTTTFTSDPSSPKATAVRKLYDFLTVTGVMDGDAILWDDETGNVLPEILSRILDAKRVVSIVIKDGKITEFLEPDITEEDDDVNDDNDNVNDVDNDSNTNEEDDDL